MNAYDMQDNICALLLCIFKKRTPEQAFLEITGERHVSAGRPEVEVDREWIEELRAEGRTLREIERITGYSYGTICRRLTDVQSNS